jgi:CRISPR-associated protein (TIGR02710 family)
MPLFADELHAFRERCAGRTVAGLLIPGSRQAVTAALLIGALQPQRVAFLLTPDTLDLPDQAAALLNVSGADWVRYTDDHTDALQIYRSLRTVIEAWADLPRDRLAVDLTGGTKPMSVGLAKAAYVLGIPALYIESDFGSDPSGRSVPIPGSQRLVVPPDPYAVFGDLERVRARSFFQQHDYTSAAQRFATLAARLGNTFADQSLADLASAYAAWDAFDVEEAQAAMHRFLATSLPPTLAAFQPILEQQHTQLYRLVHDAEQLRERRSPELVYLRSQERVLPLLGSLHANAVRREQQQRFDVAALLRYRCLELLSQLRLAQYGILTDAPRYDQVLRTQPDLPKAYEHVERTIFPRGRSIGMPGHRNNFKITLFNGYMLLSALSDPLVEDYDIRQIKAQSEARNRSTLAHGFRSITRDEYEPFRDTVELMLDRYLKLAQIDRNNWETVYTFIRLA